jgi:quinoprotein glucose dehydrogenase
LKNSTFTVIMLFAILGARTASADWPTWGGASTSTKFAPYDEIHAGNVDSLKILWRYRLPAVDGTRGAFKGTPIVVDGVLYTFSPSHFAVALNAATGQELWRFDAGGRGANMAGLNRGVAYWQRPDGEARILFGTNADTLYSLDAATGMPDSTFGVNGRVDLTLGLRAPVPDVEDFGLASPPTIVGDVAIVGSIIMDWHDGVSPDEYTAPGDVRGYDVRTGELLWTFHTIPQPGEVGYHEWADQSWDHFGSANVWATISADTELGIAYLPVSSVSHDRYGGERLGNNLFSDCLVAVDARTGERLWHYQFIHHTLWNYDPPAAPILMDVDVDGRSRKIVVQLTKQAMAYVLDRVTGEPIWPIEERAVPTTSVAGEQPSPTQPFPTKPAPYDRQGLTEDDLIDFTPQLRQQARAIIADYDTGPLYLPPSLRGVIQVPGELGGTDWVGGSADPATGVLYVPSKTMPRGSQLIRSGDPTAFSRYGGQTQNLSGPQGLPLTKPPYSRITAIDMKTGEHLWMRAIGRGPIDHPALQGVTGLPDELGWQQRVFLLTTPTLLFATSGHPGGIGGNGTSGYFIDREASLRAYDKTSGQLLATAELSGNTEGGLISYQADGRQFIAASIGGGGEAELVAVAVPRAGEPLPPQTWAGYAADHPRFEEALALLDAGDVDGLAALLDAEPELVHAHGYLDGIYPVPEQVGATLLHLTSGSDRGRLPENIVQITQMLLDRGADPVALTADSTSWLDLVVGSQQLGWLGHRSTLVATAIEYGAPAGPELMHRVIQTAGRQRGAFPEDHFQAAHDLRAAGVPVDLPFAAALGLNEQLSAFFDADDNLLPSANTEYRPNEPDERSTQEILDISLCYAAYGGSQEAVDWLVARGASVDAQTPGFIEFTRADFMSPVNCATWSDDDAMIRHLAALGADLEQNHPKFGFTPVWLANFLDRPRAKAVLRELLAEDTAADRQR